MEYVQAKAYNRFEWKKPTKPEGKNKRAKSRQEEQKSKEKDRREEQEPGKGKKPGKKPLSGSSTYRATWKGEPPGKKPGKGVATKDRSGRSGGVDRHTPEQPNQRIWAHAERIYPNALEGRRGLPAGPQRGPARESPLPRQGLGGRTPFQALGPGEPPAPTTRPFTPMGPVRGGSSRGSQPTDVTDVLHPVRVGDSVVFKPLTGNVRSTRQIPVIKGEVIKESTPVGGRSAGIKPLGLTQHAEPKGQMSLFPGPERETNLSTATAARSERQNSTPAAFSPLNPRQGTLFNPARFK